MGTMAAALVRLLGAQGQHVEDAAASMHASIAGRVFRALGPLGAPTRAVHDTVAEGVHGLVRASLGGTGWLGGVLAEAVPDEVLLASPRGRTLVGAVLGLIGDRVREEEPDLAWPTVLLGQGAVSAGEVVVLLHGLCETDLAWSMGATVARPGLAEVLDEPGRSVLVARMNTGLRAAELGRDLATLLEEQTGGTRVVLVGHSLGGLVGRAAPSEESGGGGQSPPILRAC